MKLRTAIEDRYGARFQRARASADKTFLKARLAAAKRFGPRRKGAPKAAVPIAGVIGAASAWVLARHNGHESDQPAERRADPSNEVTPKNGEVGDLRVGGAAPIQK
jgi:hypothetical protein